MKIVNAKIKDVSIALNTQGYLCVSLSFIDSINEIHFDHTFVLQNNENVLRLEKLMQYTNSTKLHDLEDKSIRIFFNYSLNGFGHPTEDKFIKLYTRECKEISAIKL